MSQSPGLVHRTVAARAGQAPHPALLLLHGRGSNELDLLGLAPEVDPRFFVISARAPFSWMGGYRWYELDGPGRAEETTFNHSLARLTRFVDDLAEAYSIDPARFHLLGFSQGAMMSNALLLTAPERVAGAVLLSGFQPKLEQLAVQRETVRGKPCFVAHGTWDGVLDVAMGRAVRDTLTELGLDLVYREYQMEHEVIRPELDDIREWLTAQLDRAG